MDEIIAAVVAILAAAVSIGCMVHTRQLLDEAREIEQRRLKLLVRKEMRRHK